MHNHEKFHQTKEDQTIARLTVIEQKIGKIVEELRLLRQENHFMKKKLAENRKNQENFLKIERDNHRLKNEHQQIAEYVKDMGNNLKDIL
ncbi:MAG: hypothetical protein ACMUJM_00765 [bacterium]